jgi:hypothetical protein
MRTRWGSTRHARRGTVWMTSRTAHVSTEDPSARHHRNGGRTCSPAHSPATRPGPERRAIPPGPTRTHRRDDRPVPRRPELAAHLPRHPRPDPARPPLHAVPPGRRPMPGRRRADRRRTGRQRPPAHQQRPPSRDLYRRDHPHDRHDHCRGLRLRLGRPSPLRRGLPDRRGVWPGAGPRRRDRRPGGCEGDKEVGHRVWAKIHTHSGP